MVGGRALVSQLAEETDSKPVQCEFESHRGHQITQLRQPPTQAPESVPSEVDPSEVDPSDVVSPPAVESLVGSLVTDVSMELSVVGGSLVVVGGSLVAVGGSPVDVGGSVVVIVDVDPVVAVGSLVNVGSDVVLLGGWEVAVAATVVDTAVGELVGDTVDEGVGGNVPGTSASTISLICSVKASNVGAISLRFCTPPPIPPMRRRCRPAARPRRSPPWPPRTTDRPA